MRHVAAMLRAWWTASVDYWWVVDYLRVRGLEFWARMVIAMCAAALAVVPLVMHSSPSGPSGQVAPWVSLGCAGVAVCWVVRWMVGPWPSLRESLLFVALSDIAITVASLQDSDPLTGMFGLNALALMSAYILVFHDPRVQTAHIGWAMLSIGAFAIMLATGPDADVRLAAAKSLVTALAIAGAPPFIQFAYWLLRTDADESLIDPLTRLLNRRGLHTNTSFIPADSRGPDIVVMTIDLDFFKTVNDTYGHAIGDEVLVRTARRIESVARGHAIIARIGGEEFVLVDVMDKDAAESVAHRIRHAIAAPADRAPVTASIGVAAMPIDWFVGARIDRATVVDALIAAADVAMYAAKDAGRDSVRADFSPVEVPPGADPPGPQRRMRPSAGQRRRR